MGALFWTKRFLIALLFAGVLLFVVELAKGHAVVEAARFAAFWGVVSAALFTLIGYDRYRRNPTCMLPRSDRQ